MTPLDNYYFGQEEPHRSCLLALRDIILAQHPDVTTAWKYSMPFFCFRGKMFCYVWVHKKWNQPYLGIVEGSLFDEPFLIQEKRSRMKIMLIDPNQDIPIDCIHKLLQKTLQFYTSGVINIK